MHGLPNISAAYLDAFCQRWKVSEMSLFGSSLRDDFTAESDVDVLVSFDAAASWSLLDLMRMREELSERLGRPVDLVEKEAIRNPFRRHEILGNRRVIYAA